MKTATFAGVTVGPGIGERLRGQKRAARAGITHPQCFVFAVSVGMRRFIGWLLGPFMDPYLKGLK
jgi:hypothetical protein